MTGGWMVLGFCVCSTVSKGYGESGHGADPMAGGEISWTTLALLLLLALGLAAIHLLGCLAARRRNATPIPRIRGY